MRLKQLKQHLDRAIPNLNVILQNGTHNGKGVFIINNLDDIRKAVNTIAQTGLFKQSILGLKESQLFTFGEDRGIFDIATGHIIDERITSLREMAIGMSQSLSTLIGEVFENTIYIKLPFLQDFEDLSNIANSFQQILAQVIIDEEINGEIKILSVENGSIWIEVFLGSYLAVKLIGRMAKEVTNIQSWILQNDILRSKAQTAKVSTERFKAFSELESQLLEHYIEIEAHSIEIDFFKTDKPERLKKIKNALSLLTEQWKKGAEIQPALNAPDEVKAEFPAQSLIESIREKLKLLSSKNDTEQE